MRTATARSKARATANPAHNGANSAANPPVSTTIAPATPAAPDVGASDAGVSDAAASAAPTPARTHNILRSLGLIGLESIEPIILAAIATETPLLLIGTHGTAKSLLLSRLCEALDLPWRHYNASLVNYDDLIGYPLPDAQGQLKFIQTPASVWGAAAVFIDELSRARPDMLNRLFPIIHERKVQGLDLPTLRFRWAAMNPPASPDSTTTDYSGSEPLDAALADRFGFVVQVPGWHAMSERDQTCVITSAAGPVPVEAAHELRAAIAHVTARIPALEQAFGEAFAEYVRRIAQHTARLQLPLSGRRAAMLYRNLLAVHAACDRVHPGIRPEDTTWIALRNALPHTACGHKIDEARLQLAHNEVWKALQLDHSDPRRLLSAEPDAVRRLLMSLNFPNLSMQEVSSYAADALARLPAGGRHALALHLLDSNAASRLITAVAEQVSQLFGEVSAAQNVNGRVAAGGNQHQAWQEVVRLIAETSERDPDRVLIENLLAGQWSKGSIARPGDAEQVLASWRSVRTMLAGGRDATRSA